MRTGTTGTTVPMRTSRLRRSGSRSAGTVVGALMGTAFAATLGDAPWILLLGLGALALAALWGGYDSREGNTLWRPPSPR